ncbi:MAG: HAD family phosphatase [Clostridiales bacterium]|nr:HAD family phosphatase [Clostridiales bacterium]
MAIKAVLFDMDGLLLDTEALAIQASIRAAEAQGIGIGEELHRLMLGTNKEKSNELLKQRVPQLDLEKFWTVVDAQMWQQVELNGVPVKPFVRELLKWSKDNNLLMGLCSSSYREVVEPFVSRAGLTQYFSAIVAGDDDMSLGSKPAPGMYLRTAHLLGVLPEECLVLEDSPNGLRSGRAAGMTTVMIPDLIPYSEDLAPYSDAVFSDLSYIPAYIEELRCQSAY